RLTLHFVTPPCLSSPPSRPPRAPRSPGPTPRPTPQPHVKPPPHRSRRAQVRPPIAAGFEHAAGSSLASPKRQTRTAVSNGKPRRTAGQRHGAGRCATSAFFKHFDFMLVDREGREIPCVH